MFHGLYRAFTMDAIHRSRGFINQLRNYASNNLRAMYSTTLRRSVHVFIFVRSNGDRRTLASKNCGSFIVVFVPDAPILGRHFTGYFEYTRKA